MHHWLSMDLEAVQKGWNSYLIDNCISPYEMCERAMNFYEECSIMYHSRKKIN